MHLQVLAYTDDVSLIGNEKDRKNPRYVLNACKDISFSKLRSSLVGLDGLGETCSPRDPRFSGSNPTEVNGFFQDGKNPDHKSSWRDFKLGSQV